MRAVGGAARKGSGAAAGSIDPEAGGCLNGNDEEEGVGAEEEEGGVCEVEEDRVQVGPDAAPTPNSSVAPGPAAAAPQFQQMRPQEAAKVVAAAAAASGMRVGVMGVMGGGTWPAAGAGSSRAVVGPQSVAQPATQPLPVLCERAAEGVDGLGAARAAGAGGGALSAAVARAAQVGPEFAVGPGPWLGWNATAESGGVGVVVGAGAPRGLVVCASLLDNVPNMAGLCR